ncbi:type VI secretion system baseplate subunit TssF [Planktomarina sp.]|nr:type VI secretion system baseplate subunit TssF [Planktomarina sp.]MDB4841595.1 type VI secretion system baseplate subunit TssF [Planktomarina sp.]
MDDILQHYEAELDYMRRAFSEFEVAHPQKARALNIKAGQSGDPDVQRLSDSLALVSARLSKRLDDTLPEFALDLARMIAPTFLLGAPAYCPVQMVAAETSLMGSLLIDAGTTLDIEAKGDRPACRFSVARPTQVAPVKVSGVQLERAPLSFELPNELHNCEAAIRVALATFDESLPLSDILSGGLELYVSATGGRKTRLIDVLSGNLLGIGFAPVDDKATYMMDRSNFGIKLIADRDMFLPAAATEMPGLTRLRDFLCYPDKAAFFTLNNLEHLCAGMGPGPLELRFFLNNEGARKLTRLDDGDLATNVVPLLNFYKEQSRPVRYDYGRIQVPVVPQSTATMPCEILQIHTLHMLTSGGEIRLPQITTPGGRFSQDLPIWQERFLTGNTDPARREVSFSVMREPAPFDFVATLICSNGSGVFSARQGMEVFFADKQLAEVPFKILEEPTVPIEPNTSADRLWDILSLINGNFASVFDAPDPTQALKEALHLCAPAGLTGAADAIWTVTVEQSVAPVRVGKHVLLSTGSQIEVTLDFETLPFPPFVFGAALQMFLNALISYDRFLQLRIRERGCEEPFVIFPTIHGGQISG